MLVLAFFILLAACGRPEIQDDADERALPPADGSAPLLACEEFVRAVQAQAARSRAELRTQFGEPDSVVVDTAPNRHVANATDTITRLYFPDVSAYVLTAQGNDLLESLEFHGNAHLPPGALVIGVPRARIDTVYGEPEYAAGDTLVYVCNATEAGGETVRFVFGRDSVVSMAIGFYVD